MIRRDFMSSMRACAFLLVAVPGLAGNAVAGNVRFEVTLAKGITLKAPVGRLLVAIGPAGRREPRHAIGRTAMKAPPLLGRDVDLTSDSRTWMVDDTCAVYPHDALKNLAAGDYVAQPVLMVNRDIWLSDAGGNLYGKPVEFKYNPSAAESVRLSLDTKIEPDELPEETDHVKFRWFRSALLSRFHGRDMFLRVGIILPRSFATDADRRYPLWVRIGGFGTRYTAVGRMMSAMSPFRRAWMAKDGPRMVLLHLDGAGPLGDPYQVNSDNNGPYGDAITQELIPAIEKEFRCIGEPRARFTEGGSTGGWVSLAMQVFYPGFFNGCWSGFPDSVDFRHFELINIYRDDNAYVNTHGAERPSMRQLNGDVVYTVRNECQRENLLGLGDSYTMGGLDWGCWNATYGPRGKDGRPVPIWDPQTGRIDRKVTRHWRQYDLRRVLEENWSTLGPQLRGKLHVWVGECDEYFLNNGVRALDEFLSSADPPYEGYIKFSPRAGHGWMPMSTTDLMAEMMQRVTQPDKP